jgi:hypothetical protein
VLQLFDNKRNGHTADSGCNPHGFRFCKPVWAQFVGGANEKNAVDLIDHLFLLLGGAESGAREK